MANFPPWAWIRKCISCKLTTITTTERGGVCCSRNLNNLTACLRIYSIYQTRCNYKSSWTLVCLLLFRGTTVLDSGTYPKFDFQVPATIQEMGWSTALRTVRKGYASDKNEISARTAHKDSLSLLILYLNKWQAQPFQTVLNKWISLNFFLQPASNLNHWISGWYPIHP